MEDGNKGRVSVVRSLHEVLQANTYGFSKGAGRREAP